jgi:hypothetical protein
VGLKLEQPLVGEAFHSEALERKGWAPNQEAFCYYFYYFLFIYSVYLLMVYLFFICFYDISPCVVDTQLMHVPAMGPPSFLIMLPLMEFTAPATITNTMKSKTPSLSGCSFCGSLLHAAPSLSGAPQLPDHAPGVSQWWAHGPGKGHAVSTR